MDHTAGDTLSDAALVAAAVAGDREALGRIYDRYADRVHSMCTHMLADSHEAADVCGDVFLTAFQRLDQLRDADRLKPWIFAITRHEVYRRTKQRRRVDLMGEVDEMDRIAAGDTLGGLDEGTPDPAELARLVHEAATGLDDRDRMVMELQLQGLDGEDLAGALGTSTSTAYQHVHRMKERLERSLGAVLVARQGRADCEDLDRLLHGWDGQFSVLWRKRVARHVDGCEVCERRRKAVPAALLGGVAAAAPMLSATSVSAAPASVRERVLRDARVGTGGSGWRSDGFPPADGAGRVRTPLLAAGAVLVLVLALAAGLLWWTLSEDDLEVATAAATSEPLTDTTPTTTPTTVGGAEVPADSTPVVPGPELSTTTVAPPAVLPPEGVPDVPVDGGLVPPPEPPGAVPPAVVPPIPPAVELRVVPDTVFHPTPDSTDCGASTPFVVSAPTATAVVLRWVAAGSAGSAPLAPKGADWAGILEVAPPVVGPLQVRAVAVDAAGVEGASAVVTVPVQSCITPG